MPMHIGPDDVRREVERQDAGWQVLVPPRAADARQRFEPLHRLGYQPRPGGRSLHEAERVAREQLAAGAHDTLTGAAAAPPAMDWRKADGKNWITPITDQQACGSCVAFGVVAATEAMVRITTDRPTATVDLSEAQLWFCYGPSHGAGTCPDGGWWPEDALDCATQGLADDRWFRYTDADQACDVDPRWRTHVTQLTGWRTLGTAASIKSHLATVGPVVACFTVYEDFYYYASGVYRQVTGELVGGHCVCIIGYDDARRCWIAKNSWGTWWGEDGFFRIRYGQCGIDDMMYAPSGVRVTTLKAWPVLREGAEGDAVRSLHHLLRARGATLSVSGTFTSRTKTAVRAAQDEAGLSVDGVVGAKTWAALISTQRRGSSGEAVKAVQRELRRRGDTAMVIDGIFGTGTERAVKAFQTAVAQLPDGVVGAYTWQALVSGMAP